MLRADAPREEWLRHRAAGIGSSDASAVLGLNRWSSPYVVWAEKRGLLPPKPDDDAMELGRLLEPVIVNRWSEKAGVPIRRAGLMANRERPWLIASVDRLAGCGGIVEAKSLSWRVAEEWEDGQTPDHAEAQSQHQMAVTGRDHVHVVGLQDGRTWLERRIDRDDQLIADMLSVEAELWAMVTDGVEPPIDGSAVTTTALNDRWPALDETETVLPPDVLTLIQFRDEWRNKAKAALLVADGYENKIRAAMGEATVGWLPGFEHLDEKKRPKVLYRRNGTFQAKKFEADHPALAAAVTHPRPSLDVDALKGGRPDLYMAYRSRTLRLPTIKEST